MSATPASTALSLGAEMTIAQAAAHRDTLADAVNAAATDLQLDLGVVTDFDSSGVQLLLATRRSLNERGHHLQLVAASPTVREALALFGLAELLAVPAAA